MNAKDSSRTRDIHAHPEVTPSPANDADEAHTQEAIGSVDWERRGWLGRLVRLEREPVTSPANDDRRLVA
jgi:hypothetical protein